MSKFTKWNAESGPGEANASMKRQDMLQAARKEEVSQVKDEEQTIKSLNGSSSLPSQELENNGI